MVELGTRRTYRKGACRKLSACRLCAPQFYPDPHFRISPHFAAVTNWHEVIGDSTIADATCDRIIHNAHRIELKGDSVRKIYANN